MNTQSIIKTIMASTAILTITFLPSCQVFDPNYAAYKKQQAAQAATTATNPYGVPAAAATTAANPYAVPGANGETGTSVPYQPIPGVTSTPTPSYVDSIPVPNIPSTPAYTPLPETANATGSTHTVVKGDTIWGLTRKYGVTGDQIKAANSLQSDTIWVGQRLVIPTR